MARMTKTILFYVILMTIFVLYIFLHTNPVQLKNGIYVNPPQNISSFEMTDHHGHVFTDQRLKGEWSLLFFGFTSCPMICPAVLQTLKQVDESLPASKKLEVILVSVDPEHDSVQRLNEYMQSFNKNFIALTSEMSAVNALQKQLHVPVSNEPSTHGTEIILINPQGQIQAYFKFPITNEALLQDLNKVIGK